MEKTKPVLTPIDAPHFAKPIHVCIITTVHHARDDRIYHKEALSLVDAGFDVAMVASWTPELDSGPVKKLTLPTFQGKMGRFIRGTFSAFQLALKEDADVYHFHDPELLPLGVALKCLGKRVIYDVHEDYSKKILSRKLPAILAKLAAKFLRAFEAVCAWSFDYVIATDSHVASLFPADKTKVIANYPPLRFISNLPAPNPQLGKDRPFRIVYVGGISLIRGVGRILDALDLMHDETVELHLAGKISDPELEKRIKTHSCVTYHGLLPWEKVNQVLAQADVGMVLFQPLPGFLYCPGENIIKLWEYMGMGLPVIISDFPKLKQLIRKLDAGLTVDPTSASAIAKAIQRLRAEPQLRQRFSTNGRAAVLKDRNWDAEAARLVVTYHELMAGRSSLKPTKQTIPNPAS